MQNCSLNASQVTRLVTTTISSSISVRSRELLGELLESRLHVGRLKKMTFDIGGGWKQQPMRSWVRQKHTLVQATFLDLLFLWYLLGRSPTVRAIFKPQLILCRNALIDTPHGLSQNSSVRDNQPSGIEASLDDSLTHHGVEPVGVQELWRMPLPVTFLTFCAFMQWASARNAVSSTLVRFYRKSSVHPINQNLLKKWIHTRSCL